MKSIQKTHQIFNLSSKSTVTKHLSSSSTFASLTLLQTQPQTRDQTQTETQTQLTQQDITSINLLLPRLCLSSNLNTATHLVITSLLTNPPPNSISLSPLIHSFTSQPDLTRPISLLTRLIHHPPSLHVTPIAASLIESYLKKNRPREALKVFKWMVRRGLVTGGAHERVYGVLVCGFVRSGMVLEGLSVVRVMMREAGIAPGCGVRRMVWRGLLREARIAEAVELDKAFEECGVGEESHESEGFRKALGLLDGMIENWSE